tara:strand:- start:3072 stop:3677 length:606 start_codon:yes stop_codon:yes gene_type:complete
MKRKVAYSIVATALATALAAPVFAAEEYYVGGSAGRTDAKEACDGLDSIGFVGSCDDTDTGWKLFGGYRFTPNFGAEAFYADLGEFSASGTILGDPATANDEANGFGVSAIGTWPISDEFGVFGKLGFFRWDLESSATIGAVSVSVDDKGTDLTFGVGASYSFNESFSIRVEWERFNDVGEEDTTGKSDVDFLSAGVVLSF